MSPAANTLLALILIALGCLGITLSFLVPDRKKSLIALGLAAAIIVMGLFQWSSSAFDRFRLNRRMKELQRERQVDLDALRQRLKDQAGSNPAAAGANKKP